MPDFMDDEESDPDGLFEDSADEKGDFTRLEKLGGKTEL